ncbi:hypothetical protein AT984_04360 [Paucibacter sp. KCTC 42545]|nr:hypothetical protein AT984_04360 [Paucibacter sp. KCTC 42545]
MCLAVGSSCLVGGVSATETAADKLAALQAQRALNKVRLDVAKQEAEIVEANQKKGAASPPPAAPPPRSPSNSAPVEMPAPSLVSITSVGEQVSATVISAGIRKTARVGESLPGGWLVTGLKSSSVTVSRGSQVVTLRL